MEATTLRRPRLFLSPLRVLSLILCALLIIAACYLYARLIEVDWLRIKQVSIPVRNLPAAFENFLIVHLSDLHVTELGKREKRLPAMVNGINADAIFITGDFAQNEEGSALAASIVSQLKPKYGIWGIGGNWDSNDTLDAMEAAGLKMLRNEVDVIEVDNENLGIVGLRFDVAMRAVSLEEQRRVISRLKSRLPPEIPLILLSHMPRIIDAAQEEDIDLVLAGHTHGGQVRIPFGPAIITPSDMGLWRSKGLFKYEETHLYISPGIGLEPGPDWIKVRFWCRPEITALRLVKA